MTADYRCHQCFAEIAFEEIAHTDLFFDLCWIQCETCAAAFGPACGTDRHVNPHPHGYFACPLRVEPLRQIDSHARPVRLRS